MTAQRMGEEADRLQPKDVPVAHPCKGTFANMGAEREVLGQMAEGHNNPSIARTLAISDAAVAKHIGNIFTKLDLPEADGHRRVLAVLTYLRS